MRISQQLGDKIDDRGRRTRTGSDKDISSDEDSNLSDRPVTESATAWDRQDFRGPSKETDTSDIPVYNECFIPDRRRPVKESPDITSDEDSKLFGRPVTGSVTEWDGGDTDNPSEVHVKCCKRPVTESVTARASDTEEPLVMTVSSVTIELSELRTSVCGETDTSDIPGYNECLLRIVGGQ